MSAFMLGVLMQSVYAESRYYEYHSSIQCVTIKLNMLGAVIKLIMPSVIKLCVIMLSVLMQCFLC